MSDTLTKLNEAIRDAQEDVEDNKQMDPNSYGVGFDEGYLAGLHEAKTIVEETAK